MLRAVTALFLALAPVTAHAFDVSAMTDDERAAFGDQVRSYLLENPEVIMEAIQELERRRTLAAQEKEQQMLVSFGEQIFDDGFSYVGGNPDGDVTIVEFLDYRCGYCKRAFPAVEELIASDGNIRFIIKEFPILGEASVLASQYAISVKMLEGDEVYKQVHDDLMEHRGEVTDAVLARLSENLDLDHDAIMERMDDEDVLSRIAENRILGDALEIQGTPAFIMGDNIVRGFLELDQMRAIVDAIREERS